MMKLKEKPKASKIIFTPGLDNNKNTLENRLEILNIKEEEINILNIENEKKIIKIQNDLNEIKNILTKNNKKIIEDDIVILFKNEIKNKTDYKFKISSNSKKIKKSKLENKRLEYN